MKLKLKMSTHLLDYVKKQTLNFKQITFTVLWITLLLFNELFISKSLKSRPTPSKT